MAWYDSYAAEYIELDLIAGRNDIPKDRGVARHRMYFEESFPGIVWFEKNRLKEYEVVDYRWEGPRYQDVMIQDHTANTETRGKRKGRLAGAVIGTILLPGVGTVIGAAVGTGRKEVSDTRGRTRSHIETQEVPAMAEMRLRDIDMDEYVRIRFNCTADLDARIRNNITVNLEEPLYIDHTETAYLPEPEEKPEKDLFAQIRELKALLDEGAITQEEYEMLKKKLF